MTVRFDTHTHAVGGDRTRFPLRPTGLASEWWSEPGRDAERMLAVMDANGVDRAVLVQPIGAYGYDNSYVLSAAVRHPGRLAAVPAVDLDERSGDVDVERKVRQVAEAPGVAGVRLFGVSSGSEWTSDGQRAAAALVAAQKAGVVAVLTLFDRQIADLAPVLIHSPSPIALDHCGFPKLRDGLLPDTAPLRMLRAAGHVALKISTHLLREAAEQGDPARLVEQLAEEFGPDRLVWGSDYPQTGRHYQGMVHMAERAAAGLGAREQAGFFGQNAARLFDRPGLW